MNLNDLGVTNQFDIVDQWYVDTLRHVELLEETVVLLTLIVEVVDDVLVEDLLLDVHQRLDVL